MKKILCALLTLMLLLPTFALAEGPIELTYYFPTQTTGPLAIGMEEIVAEFNATHPDIHVTAVFAGDYGGVKEKTLTAMAGGNAPHVILLTNLIHDMLAMDALVDINTLLAKEPENFLDDYVSGFFDAFIYPSGEMWGIPFQHSSTLLYFNNDMLKAAGVEKAPTNWTELEATCRALKAWNPDVVPFSFMGDTWIMEALALANGGAIHKDYDTMWLDNEQLIETVTFYKHLVDEGLAVVDNSYGGASENFMAEYYAMMTNTSGSLSGVANTAAFNWDIGPLPAGDGKESVALMGGGGLRILKYGHSEEEIDASWEFVKYMTSPAVSAKWMITSGYFAMRYGSYEEESLLALMAEKPQYESVKQFLPIIHGTFKVNNTTDTGAVIQRALDECFLNNADIPATLQQAQIDAQAFLDANK